MRRQTRNPKAHQLLQLLRENLKTATSAIALTTISLTSFGQQYTDVLEQGNNVKGYSTEMCTDYTTQGETVKAGTIYDYTGPGQHVAHFLNIDNAGNVNSTNYYQDPNFEEIRAVDIVGDENGGYGAPSGTATYYITCQGRTLRDNDRVLIIPVDRTGAMVGPALRIYPSDGSGGTDNDVNMYPLHSIYNAATGAVFVTGYMTVDVGNGNTSLSSFGEPDYSNICEKYAFILKATFSAGAWTYNPLTDIRTVNTVFTGLPGTYSIKEDFDIGMRLVEVNGGSDIFMTGSVNNFVTNTSTGAVVQHSATMNVVFDNALTIPASSVNHFRNGSEVTYFGDEYGVGLVENGNGEYFVIGNYFYRQGTFSGKGFNPQPAFFWGTWIDNTFTYTTTGQSRATFNGYDYAWGLQTIEGPAASAASASRFVLAGMEVNEWCASGGTYSDNDVRAFLHDIELDYSGGTITPTYYSWNTFHTQLGTGNASVDANSYYNLGGGISNIAWNPTYAARESVPDDIYLAAPTWRLVGLGLTPTLNMKNIRVDGDAINLPSTYLDDPNCAGSALVNTDPSTFCGINPYIKESVFALGDGTIILDNTQNHPGVVTDDALTPTSGAGAMTVSTFAVTQNPCTGGTPNYKNGNLAEVVEKTRTTTIYPNPATDNIKVSLANTIADDATVKVTLYNIYGQAISTLYQGQAAGLTTNRNLQLTDVATGIYLVNITVNGTQVLNEKLTIN